MHWFIINIPICGSVNLSFEPTTIYTPVTPTIPLNLLVMLYVFFLPLVPSKILKSAIVKPREKSPFASDRPHQPSLGLDIDAVKSNMLLNITSLNTIYIYIYIYKYIYMYIYMCSPPSWNLPKQYFHWYLHGKYNVFGLSRWYRDKT